MTTLEIKFKTKAAAEHFVRWMSASGEQQYWRWMEVQEEAHDGPITATRFIYDFATPAMRAVCGRLTEEE